MNELELKERITNLVMEAFLAPEDAPSPASRLLRAGVESQVTENILRLTEDFYVGSNAKMSEALEGSHLAEISAIIEEWLEKEQTDYQAASHIYSLLKNKGYLK